MPRWVVFLAALVGLPAGLVAQSDRVSVSLGLEPDGGRGEPRRPIVYLRNLLTDSRWSEHLDNSLPVIVTHRLALWRSRDGWIDELRSEVEWRVLVTKEPLLEEYTVTVVYGTGNPERPRRFATRDGAAAYLQLGNQVEFVPTRAGRFYYTLTTRITALSDADMDQLERFLAGDPELAVGDRGSMLARAIRRVLLRIAGLPSEVLQARSDQFEVRREE
jgi:hypothetical protein